MGAALRRSRAALHVNVARSRRAPFGLWPHRPTGRVAKNITLARFSADGQHQLAQPRAALPVRKPRSVVRGPAAVLPPLRGRPGVAAKRRGRDVAGIIAYGLCQSYAPQLALIPLGHPRPTSTSARSGTPSCASRRRTCSASSGVRCTTRPGTRTPEESARCSSASSARRRFAVNSADALVPGREVQRREQGGDERRFYYMANAFGRLIGTSRAASCTRTRPPTRTRASRRASPRPSRSASSPPPGGAPTTTRGWVGAGRRASVFRRRAVGGGGGAAEGGGGGEEGGGGGGGGGGEGVAGAGRGGDPWAERAAKRDDPNRAVRRDVVSRSFTRSSARHLQVLVIFRDPTRAVVAPSHAPARVRSRRRADHVVLRAGGVRERRRGGLAVRRR